MEDLSHLIDTLLGQAASLQREAERMQTVLEEAKFRVDPEQRTEASEQPLRAEESAPSREIPRLRAVAHPEEADPPRESLDAAGARLLATQMAVSGSSREEIESRLRNRFEIEDTSSILDAILGPEE